MYYLNKVETLKDIFAVKDIYLENDWLIVGEKRFPIIDDVIILLEPCKWPEGLRSHFTSGQAESVSKTTDYAEDIQFTFSSEWEKFPDILPEHKEEFNAYFDLVDLKSLKNLRVCDLGCGIGRWSFFLKNRCRELVLIDFSESIFVARHNLSEAGNVIFIMADIMNLPLRKNFSDFLFCIGVLHHFPVNALEEVRRLKDYSSSMLVYLYYSLDNRPFYFRILLWIVIMFRLTVSKNRNKTFRSFFTYFTAIFIYLPLIKIGKLLSLFKASKLVPIYDGYRDKSLLRIRQDVYDRFFTRIEQRFSRKEILGLSDSFKEITISENWPYWHFLCKYVR